MLLISLGVRCNNMLIANTILTSRTSGTILTNWAISMLESWGFQETSIAFLGKKLEEDVPCLLYFAGDSHILELFFISPLHEHNLQKSLGLRSCQNIIRTVIVKFIHKNNMQLYSISCPFPTLCLSALQLCNVF